MVVAYHTHEFQIPTASEAEVAAGTESGKVVTPATLGSSTAFATAAQGALADTALQPADVGTAAAAATTDFATAAQGGLADTAVQPATLTAGLATKQPVDASLTTLSGKTIGTKGLDVLAGAAASDVINTLGGAAGQFVNAQLADLDAAKLTGTIDPARIPILPSAKQVVSSGGIADLTAPQQAEIGQGTIVTTTDGRRWVYTGTGSKVLEASYIVLADITPEWDQIANKPALATGAQGTLADSAVQPGDPVSDLAETTTAKIMSGDERTKLGALPDNAALTASLATKQGRVDEVYGVEIGAGLTGDRPSYLDFHSSGAPYAGDFDARINREGGVDGNWSFSQTGTGPIIFQSTGGAYFASATGAYFTQRPTVGGVGVALQSELGTSSYKGAWNATTNSPAITAGVGTTGDFYITSVAGTQSITGSSELFSIGDQARFNGTTWQRIPNFEAVNSVFGRTGTIVSVNGDYNAGQVTYNGGSVAGQLDLLRGQTNLYGLDASALPNASGFYRQDGVLSNGPSNGGNGLNHQIIQIGDNGRGFQLAQAYTDPDQFYFRSGIDGWRGWKKLANTEYVDAKFAIVNPESYGLVGDGVTDNTAAWASMQSALPSQGALVVWPAKRFYFASQITQSKPIYHMGVPCKATPAGGSLGNANGTVWGFGSNGSFSLVRQLGGKFQGISFIKTAEGTELFTMPQGAFEGQSGSSYVDFEQCLFYGSCTVATVYITNALLLTFKSCRFNNTYKGGDTKCVWLDGSQFGVAGNVRSGDNVDNIEFSECIATGVAKVSSSDYAQRIDGFYLDGKCDSTKFFQCKALWCYYGIVLTNSGPTTQVPNFTRWAQGGMENNYKNAIYLHYGDITTFSDMYASLDSDVDSSTIYGNTDVVLQGPNYAGATELTACLFRGGKRSGVRTEGGRLQINGGQIGNCGQRSTGYSVEILSTVAKVIMQGVDCTTLSTGSAGANQTSAVRNLKGAAGIIINGCDLSGYTTAISGTSTGAGITGNLT